MKLILFKTETNQSSLNSLKIAQQFFQGDLEIISDFTLDVTFESNPTKPDVITFEFSTEDLQNYIKTLDEPIFIATSNTVFSAECFTTCFNAYNYFSNQFHSTLIQPTFDNDMLAYPSPSLLFYGDRRIYMTSNRITNNSLIAFGHSKVISEIVDRLGSVETNNKPILSDGIFHGGETIVLSPMPPLAWNLDKELPVLVSSAEWDAKTYIANIDQIFNTQEETQ